MTQVDFYLLSNQDALHYLCRLTEKIHKLGHRLFIHAASADQAKQIDDLLWSYDPGSFLPHALITEADIIADYPVLIGHADDPRIPAEIMINLAPAVAPFFSRFERVAELVGTNEATRQAARERYRFYRERGYPLKTHNL